MVAGVLDSLMRGPPHGPMQNLPLPRTDAGPGSRGKPVPLFAGASVGVAGFSALAATLLMPAASASAPLVAVGVMAIVAIAGIRALPLAHPHSRLGAANLVTLVRAGIAALVAGALCLPGGLADRPELAWVLVAIVAFGLALDGLDGWLARRAELTSTFGARFDMEVDAALAAFLCMLAIVSGKAGIWLLPLGVLRYVWVIAGLALPWLNGVLPDRRSRKVICVVQISVLTALLSPVLTQPWSAAIAVVAMAALVWSFAVDAQWLWRRR